MLSVIGLILFPIVRQSDIAQDFEQALAGKKLSGAAFHQAIEPVLAKYGAQNSAKFQKTVGDKRGMILTINGGGPNWDSTKTWRIFLWPENNEIRAQVIKRFGDYSTTAIDFYTDGEAFWRNDQLVIAGKDFDGSTVSRAGLTSYTYEDAYWKLSQHVNSEYQGAATFARLDQSIDPSRVMVRTRLRPDHFHVPANGPMLTYTETWQLKGGQYEQSKPQLQDTGIAELDALAGYAQTNDHKDFDPIVPTNYQDILWKILNARGLDVHAKSEGDADSANQFSFDSPTYTNFIVTLAKMNGHWTVTQVLQG